MASTAVSGLGAAIDVAIDPPADKLVQAYFKRGGNFAADTFDTLGYNDPFRVATDDLLAVTLLDVHVPALALRRMLGDDRELLSHMLEAIPIATDLWGATTDHLVAAGGFWDHLVAYDGVGTVIAGKLLARKRPRLIPIVDDVIGTALPAPKGEYWVTLQASLDPTRIDRIEALRKTLSPRISTLRLLDVAVWMRYSDGRNARAAQQAVGLEPVPRPPRKSARVT